MTSIETTSTYSSEAEQQFVENELINQKNDECQVHEFLPLAELRSAIAQDPECASAYSEILESYEELEKTWNFVCEDGAPVGVELANSLDQYCVIIPSNEDSYGILYFDETGITGFLEIGKSSYEAFEHALTSGYKELQPSMMEYLSSRPSWNKTDQSFFSLKKSSRKNALRPDTPNKEKTQVV